MKYLTVCRGGLVRSVGAAHVIKLLLHEEAVPIGYDFNSRETFDLLSEWADKIIIMEPHFIEHISEKYKNKVLVCDVGPDTYYSAQNPDLINKIFAWFNAK